VYIQNPRPTVWSGSPWYEAFDKFSWQPLTQGYLCVHRGRSGACHIWTEPSKPFFSCGGRFSPSKDIFGPKPYLRRVGSFLYVCVCIVAMLRPSYMCVSILHITIQSHVREVSQQQQPHGSNHMVGGSSWRHGEVFMTQDGAFRGDVGANDR
jgi:hypothetical protein